VKVVYEGCEYSVKKFVWSECRGPFQVLRKDGSVIVDAQIDDSERYWVSTFEGIISRSEVVPTVRLYLSAQKIRKTLADAPVMLIKGA
jgi:hypothetical protein